MINSMINSMITYMINSMIVYTNAYIYLDYTFGIYKYTQIKHYSKTECNISL